MRKWEARGINLVHHTSIDAVKSSAGYAVDRCQGIVDPDPTLHFYAVLRIQDVYPGS